MEIELFKGFQWWISAIEIPVIVFLTSLILKTRNENIITQEKLKNITNTNYIQLKDALNSYKLEVAKNYASINYLKDVEKRLVGHLLRIEEKLENTMKKGKQI